MKHNSLLFIVVLIFYNFFFISCNKEEETTYEAEADVFVKKKLVDGVVEYAPVFYVYGTASIESVTVTPPDGETETVELEQSENYTTVFEKDANGEDFSTELPDEGVYTFDILFKDGVSYSASDYLYDEELDLPVISECYWDDANSSVYVSWEPVSNVYAYSVNFFDQDNNIVFSSIAYTSDVSEVLIDIYTSLWYETPTNDMNLTVEVNAYSYESNATEDNWAYNIECNSFSIAETVWNPTSN